MLSAEAERLILKGDQSGMCVSGQIDLSGNKKLLSLPNNLTVDVLNLQDCESLKRLPSGLKVSRLNLSGCTGLESLPADLICNDLQWHGCHLTAWPDYVVVKHSLDLSNSTQLESLPHGLKVGTLRLNECQSITTLPEGLEVCFLDMRDCTGFTNWPKKGSVRFGRLNVRDCSQLGYLPNWLTQVGQLDLRGCANISELPEHLEVSSWIDIGGTKIRSLPDSIDERCLRWRSVQVDKRIVFNATTITAEEILAEENVERRRVLLELMGYEAFFKDANATVLDSDRDAGGERRLLKVPMERDEDLVCISVICPSTGHQFIIRVPPNMKSCRGAVAWIAGFDNVEDYVLIAET